MVAYKAKYYNRSMRNFVWLCVLIGCQPPPAPYMEGPACLYEVPEYDAGRPFVVQRFARSAECVAYERLCNTNAWSLQNRIRCTTCCSECGP